MDSYTVDDVVLPILADQRRLHEPGYNGPICSLEVRVAEDHIFLRVGPRDWQWDRTTGVLIGMGTHLDDPAPVDAAATP